MIPFVSPHFVAILQQTDLRNGLNMLLATPAGLLLITLGLALLSLAVLRAGVGIVSSVYTYFLRPAPYLRRYGSWAVVTGATDGIGKALCVALAKKGMDLVLVSRTKARLEECEAELRSKFSVKVKHCAADLTKTDDATYHALADCLEGLDIGVLVNNAGMSYDHPDYLDVIDDSFIQDIITINTLAPTRLAKLVLPGMKERRRGVIVNIGSGIATVVPSGPLLSVYTATKAYVETFSQSLDAEVREFGVRVQNLAPLFVATKMSKIRRARLDAPSAAAWATAAVRQIGQDTSISPYWFHGLQIAVISLVPTAYVAGHVLRMHKGMCRAFYRKQARRQAAAAAAAAAELTDSEAEKEPKKGK